MRMKNYDELLSSFDVNGFNYLSPYTEVRRNFTRKWESRWGGAQVEPGLTALETILPSKV